MRIKHWQGYGCVNAQALKKTASTAEGIKTITIEVVGNHECGLDRSNDEYDIYNWLLKRFDKDVEDFRDILKIEYEEDSIDVNGVNTDRGIYTITYKWPAFWKGMNYYKYGW